MTNKNVKTPANKQLAARRQPSQDRALQTVDALFEAVAQILEREGEGALSTNRVAQVAGFSVGTLYQYFSSKDVLVQAMAQRMQDQVLEQIERYLSDLEERDGLPNSDPKELVDEAVRIVVHSMTFKGKNKSLLRLFWMLEKPDQTSGAVKRVAERLALFFERMRPVLHVGSPSASEVFVLTRAMLGVLRCASLEKSALLGSLALDQALSKMAWGLLGQDLPSRRKTE